jgi:putative ABC transport system permease protein
MIKNYISTGWRQILKNKLYAAINILGLVVGLAVYIFGSLLVTYERSHDTFYENFDRIFTVGSVFSATANIGVGETDGVYTAFAPLFISAIPEMEEAARTVRSEFLITIDGDNYYQKIRFADPSFLKIFDFNYVEGDHRALDDPSGVLMTRSSATKFFGDSPALGQTLTLDHDVSLHVTAVIADLPPNTHFNSSLLGSTEFEVVAPLAALNRASGYDLAGNFSNLSMGDFTYMLLPEKKSREWLQAKIDGVYESHFPEGKREFITGLKVRPLIEANTILWDAVGMPMLDSIRVLALLVLVVAIVNYTNLATAQSLGRAREVGLRKTMGAGPAQLLIQFMVESLCIAAISMLIALALLEMIVPIFNSNVGRGLVIDYAITIPWLMLTTIAVGLVSGAYPAYLITRASPIDGLRDNGSKGAGGKLFRSILLGLQFSISIFMLSMVLIVYFQNEKVESSSNIYPRSQIITLQRLDVESIQSRLETLRDELNKLPGIDNVSYSSQVPYQQSNSAFGAGPVQGDEDSAFLLTQLAIDRDFLATYEIPLLTGRNFSVEVGGDTVKEGVPAVNVIVNELALERLGYSSPGDALGQVFYDFPDEREPRAYSIIGITQDQNFMGFHNSIKPTVFMMRPDSLRYASIRVSGAGLADTLSRIESVWDELIPEYPIQSEFLDETFDDMFEIYRAMTVVLGGFAFVALTLSLIGLFGLAAFMAESRTREIGIRKVMGASMAQIVRLLIWQFSRPVMWALLVAMPLSYFASGIYLNFFAERLTMPAGIVAVAGLLAVFFSWLIVAIHAAKVARANPIDSLRYE